MTIFDGPLGSTPLEPDDQEGLVPTWIATRADLNAAEQDNVASATTWVRGRRWEPGDFSQDWLKDLHRRMFSDVWRWAGSYRRRDTNMGLAWFEIPVAVEEMVRDMNVQVGGAWPCDEVAVRFHHRLVFIHPFLNGNGRHARLATDVLVEGLGEKRFGWGAGARLTDAGTARDEYLAALRSADRDGDFEPLLRFARSERSHRS